MGRVCGRSSFPAWGCIYRQPVEAMETANVVLSGNVGMNWDEASSEQCAVRCAAITSNVCLDVARILSDAL